MGSHQTQGTLNGQEDQTAYVIGQLSTLIDLVEYQDVIGRKTRYGRKPGPEPWYYTHRLLKTYAEPPNSEHVITLFKRVGCEDEIAAAKWIVMSDHLLS